MTEDKDKQGSIDKVNDPIEEIRKPFHSIANIFSKVIMPADLVLMDEEDVTKLSKEDLLKKYNKVIEYLKGIRNNAMEASDTTKQLKATVYKYLSIDNKKPLKSD